MARAKNRIRKSKHNQNYHKIFFFYFHFLHKNKNNYQKLKHGTGMKWKAATPAATPGTHDISTFTNFKQMTANETYDVDLAVAVAENRRR